MILSSFGTFLLIIGHIVKLGMFEFDVSEVDRGESASRTTEQPLPTNDEPLPSPEQPLRSLALLENLVRTTMASELTLISFAAMYR